MENKRLSNKLNSWFWFILTALPIILMLIIFIVSLPQYAKNFDWTNNSWEDFISSLDNPNVYDYLFNQFNNMSISYIRDTFLNIAFYFELNNEYLVAYVFSWMLSVQVYHLIYDVLKFIIEWCHNLIEKAY